MRKLLWLSPLLLAACATAPAPAAIGETGAVCSNNNLGRFAGQPGTKEVGAAILRASGARTVRWVRPGMMVTMEYREDRVTVWLKASPNIERVRSLTTNVIDRVTCG